MLENLFQKSVEIIPAMGIFMLQKECYLMKKIIVLLLAALLALGLMGCKKTVVLHCDGCGKEVNADPKMDESWIVFCKDCEPELDMDEK